MEVVDGRRHFQATMATVATFGHIGIMAQRVGLRLPPTSEVSPTPSLKARLYRNQWIVDCPDCGNAEFAFVDEPVFMCSNCFNGAVAGRQWRRVEFPADREEIEVIIRARPLPHNRNWAPGETVHDLRRENHEHGLPSAKGVR